MDYSRNAWIALNAVVVSNRYKINTFATSGVSASLDEPFGYCCKAFRSLFLEGLDRVFDVLAELLGWIERSMDV